MRVFVHCLLLLIVLVLGSSGSIAQTPGSQDSSIAGKLRPRWETFIFPTFPSPAKASENVQVKYYNHNQDIVSLTVYDLLNRPVLTLQPKLTVPNGLHSFEIRAGQLPTGTYFVRMVTYLPSGDVNVVQTSRVVIVR